jgi:DNA-binding beta-propeller fold protein YncE
LLAAAAVLLCGAAAAWALGELTQRPGQTGCISEDGTAGNPAAEPPTVCTDGKGLEEAFDVAVSPDGRSVYVASIGIGLAVFERDPATGDLRQLDGLAGCVVEGKANGACQDAKALHGAASVAVSPDGKSVYVTGVQNDGIVIFERDGTTGELRQLNGAAGCLTETGTARPGGAKGECQTGRQLAGAHAVAVSPDGKSVYVTARGAQAVAIFARNSAGELEQKEGKAGCISETGSAETCQDGVALSRPNDLVVSPDGKNVYVSSSGTSNAIAVFDRDAEGNLTQKGGAAACISGTDVACTPAMALEGPFGLAIDSDGKNVYVATIVESVVILDRATDGTLTQPPGAAGCISEEAKGGCRPGVALGAPFDVAVAPDAKNVYVSSRGMTNAIAVFDRDTASGDLAQKAGRAACYSDASLLCEEAKAISSPSAVTVSPDGKNLYAAALSSNAVAVFNRSLAPTIEVPPPDHQAPSVSGFKLVPRRFKASARRGSSFRFALSEQARVAIRIERRQRRGKRVFFKLRTTLRYDQRSAGSSTIRFNGKAGKRRLAPGPYRATIVATDGAGNASAPRRAAFTVLR